MSSSAPRKPEPLSSLGSSMNYGTSSPITTGSGQAAATAKTVNVVARGVFASSETQVSAAVNSIPRGTTSVAVTTTDTTVTGAAQKRVTPEATPEAISPVALTKEDMDKWIFHQLAKLMSKGGGLFSSVSFTKDEKEEVGKQMQKELQSISPELIQDRDMQRGLIDLSTSAADVGVVFFVEPTKDNTRQVIELVQLLLEKDLSIAQKAQVALQIQKIQQVGEFKTKVPGIGASSSQASFIELPFQKAYEALEDRARDCEIPPYQSIPKDRKR